MFTDVQVIRDGPVWGINTHPSGSGRPVWGPELVLA